MIAWVLDFHILVCIVCVVEEPVSTYLVLIDYFDLRIYLKMNEKVSAIIELLEQISQFTPQFL